MLDPLIRLSLALLIIIGHLGYYTDFVYLYTATVVFLLLSGYATRFYFAHRQHQTFKALFLDRLYVLGLPFLLVALSTLIVALLVNPAKLALNPVNLTFNLTFVTINFWRLFPSLYTVVPATGSMLVPQAWYSALLFQWYLAFWWLRSRPRFIPVLISASLFIFVWSLLTQTNVVNWAYLLLPGTLWLFYSGYRLAHRPSPKLALASAVFDSFLVILLTLYLNSRQALVTPAPEILVGICLGWLGLALLRFFPRRSRLAPALATLAYYLYLTHFQGIWLLEYLEANRRLSLTPPVRLLFVFGCSLLSSGILFWLMSLASRLRRRLFRSSLLLVASLSLGLSLSNPVPVRAVDRQVTAGQPLSPALATASAAAINIPDETLHAQVTAITDQSFTPYSDSQNNLSQTVTALVTQGSLTGDHINFTYHRLLSRGEQPLKIGDRILVNYSQSLSGEPLFYVIDYIRLQPLLLLFFLFVSILLLVGRRQGLQSLLGMTASFVVIFGVLLPGIRAGYHPLLVAITASLLIILVTFYLSHGFNQKTTFAVIGTLISLIFTGILATLFIRLTHLTGFASEEATFLQFAKSGALNLQGILLASVIIGALGVLDDITISQASIVAELNAANPKLSRTRLFAQAMNVGRDHISSLANTLILVYTASALPLILLFSLDPSRTFLTVINYETIAEEIVRTLVGSIGLIAAVPITTFLAARYSRSIHL